MTIFIADLPEFGPLIAGFQKLASCLVEAPKAGYWRVDGSGEITLSRKALGLTPALWHSALSGGFIGRIIEFDRDCLRIADETA